MNIGLLDDKYHFEKKGHLNRFLFWSKYLVKCCSSGN